MFTRIQHLRIRVPLYQTVESGSNVGDNPLLVGASVQRIQKKIELYTSKIAELEEKIKQIESSEKSRPITEAEATIIRTRLWYNREQLAGAEEKLRQLNHIQGHTPNSSSSISVLSSISVIATPKVLMAMRARNPQKQQSSPVPPPTIEEPKAPES